jgi:hypothetical protein
MALSRRNFVRTVGIGAAGALTTSFIGARGRENFVWSASKRTSSSSTSAHTSAFTPWDLLAFLLQSCMPSSRSD